MMARIRSIKIGFFQNEILGTLDPLTRLLFAGLWLIADRAGRLEDRPRRIQGELFPYQPDFSANDALETLRAAGFITRYQVGDGKFIQITHFDKHQKPHVKEAESVIPISTEVTEVVASTDLGSAKPDLGDGEPGGLWSLVNGLGNGLRSGSGLDGVESADAVTDALIPQNAPVTARPTFGGFRSKRSTSIFANACHPKCDGATWEACARGICVPPFVVEAWHKQLGDGSHDAIKAFVIAVLAQCPVGQPIGSDPTKFWRAQWEAKHGGVKKSSGRTIEDDSKQQEVYRRVAEKWGKS